MIDPAALFYSRYLVKEMQVISRGCYMGTVSLHVYFAIDIFDFVALQNAI